MRAGRAAIATKGDATKMRRLQCETSHKPRSEAPVTMTKTEITCGQEAVDFMKEPRMQQTNYNYEITSRQELLILIKVLLDDLEEKDPSLRAATAKVRISNYYANFHLNWTGPCFIITTIVSLTISHSFPSFTTDGPRMCRT